MERLEITVAEAVRLTGYSLAHVRWLAAQGKIRARKLGARMWLLDRVSLLAYRAANRGPGERSD